MQQFQDGATEVIGGVTYVRQGGRWRRQTPLGPARQPSPQTPAQATQDELSVEKLRNDLNSAPLDRRSKEVNIQQGETQIANSALDKVSGLGKRFEGEEAVQNYRTILPLMNSAIKAGNNKAGDLDIVYAFGKIMDPGSVVREGELVMVQNTGAIAERVKGYLQSIEGKGQLTAQQRTELREEIRNRARSANQAYNQRRAFYEDFARRHSLNPLDVVGPHPAEPFAQAEQDYIRQQGGTPKAGGSPVVAQGPTEEGFDLTPDPRLGELNQQQAAAYDAFWQANPNPTPEQLAGFVQSLGLSGSMDLNAAKAIIEHKQKTGQISHDVEFRPDISGVRGQGGVGETIDATIRGAADTATFGLADKAAAVGDTLTGDNSLQQNLARQYAISDYDAQNHPYARIGGQLVGALMVPMGEMKSIPQVALKSGAFGGAYGLGSSRSLEQAPQNTLLGALGGSAIGAGIAGAGRGLGAVGGRIGNKFVGPGTPEQQQILRAADEENVPVNMADVFPQTRNTVSTLETIPGASGPVRGGLQGGVDAIEGRVQALGKGGQAVEPAVAGASVQRAGENFISTSGAKFRQQYDALEKAAGGVKVPPTNSLARVDEAIAKLSEMPGSNEAEIAFLQKLRGDLTSNLSIGALRRFRTKLRKKISKGELTFGEDEATVLSIMDTASDDIANGLASQGRRAVAEQFAKVDGAYRERMAFITDTVQKLIGKRGQNLPPEQVFNNLKNMASPRGNSGGLGKLLNEMEPEDRADIAATFADALGKNNKGEFSIAHFVTQAGKLPKAARTHLFGPDGARSIDNLIILGRAKDATTRNLNNSRSGMVTNYRNVLSTLLLGLPGGGAAVGLAQAATVGGGVTGAVAGGAIAGTMLAGSRILAKALMNERFTRALLNAPKTTSPKAIDAHMGLLKKIATRDPNVRAVVENLERGMFNFANFANDNAKTVSGVAASGSDSESNKD